jgi:AraC family transcriptional regulator of adaptative response/methylated-DNA-[protein]-cysteine methyltransferase
MSLEGTWVDRSIADVSTDYASVREAIVFLRGHHGVLRQNGDVGKYHWGAERKAALVAWEAASGAGAVT